MGTHGGSYSNGPKPCNGRWKQSWRAKFISQHPPWLQSERLTSQGAPLPAKNPHLSRQEVMDKENNFSLFPLNNKIKQISN